MVFSNNAISSLQLFSKLRRKRHRQLLRHIKQRTALRSNVLREDSYAQTWLTRQRTAINCSFLGSEFMQNYQQWIIVLFTAVLSRCAEQSFLSALGLLIWETSMFRRFSQTWECLLRAVSFTSVKTMSFMDFHSTSRFYPPASFSQKLLQICDCKGNTSCKVNTRDKPWTASTSTCQNCVTYALGNKAPRFVQCNII